MLDISKKKAPGFMARRIHDVFPNHALDFWIHKFNSRLSTHRALARIVERQVSANKSITLTLKPNKNVQLPQAGQHLTVTAEVNGIATTRSYSTRRAQTRPGFIQITIKQVDGGKLSTWLCQQAVVGDVVELGAPFGDFKWPANQPVLMLAAGSGITPMISLLREYAPVVQQPIQLHYWVKQRSEACFIDEFLALQQHNPHFTFVLHLTQQEACQPYEQVGRIQPSTFGAMANLTNYHVLACGSAEFVQAAQQLLKPQVADWQAEAFSPPVFHHSDDIAATVEITLAKQQRTLMVSTDQSLLSALEEQGIAHPSGCRMGICNTCACKKTSGSTQHMLSGDQQFEEEPALKLCVSAARSNLVLDI